jgi:hypothetical protein
VGAHPTDSRDVSLFVVLRLPWNFMLALLCANVMSRMIIVSDWVGMSQFDGLSVFRCGRMVVARSGVPAAIV